MGKKIVVVFAVLTIVCSAKLVRAQSVNKIDSSYNNSYYQGRMEIFNTLTPPRHAIVFLGNSITERGQWHELLPCKPVMNRGIGGDNTFGVLARLDEITAAKPRKIFILIGINDIGRGLPIDVIVQNYKRILDAITRLTPKTKVYIQSVLPTNDQILKAAYLKNKANTILSLNKKIKALADSYPVQYIDLHPLFADQKGELKEEYTIDGVHLKPVAYVKWIQFLQSQKFL